MLSPLLLQQDPFFFDVLMSDPKALATLSEELCSCVTDVATVPSQTSSSTTVFSHHTCTKTVDERLYAANGALHRPIFDLSQSEFALQTDQRPASPNSGRDLESASSEASTTPTPTTFGETFFDDMLLHPRVLSRAESAAYRRQRAQLREQRRLKQQREAFEKLQEALPGNTSRLSRLDLLRLAIRHIHKLNKALCEEEGKATDGFTSGSESSELEEDCL